MEVVVMIDSMDILGKVGECRGRSNNNGRRTSDAWGWRVVWCLLPDEQWISGPLQVAGCRPGTVMEYEVGLEKGRRNEVKISGRNSTQTKLHELLAGPGMEEGWRRRLTACRKLLCKEEHEE